MTSQATTRMADADPARVTPMRIAIGIHSLQLGGSQVNTVDLSRQLRDRGHDVHLFAIHEDFKVSIVPVAERAGFDIEVLPAESSLWSQARRITEVVDRHDAQVLHVYHEDHWLGPLASMALRSRPGRALVVTNWMMENNRWLPPHAPLILGTEALCEEARCIQRGPVWLIEPPVDTERDAPDKARAADFRRSNGFRYDELLAVLVTRIDTAMKLDGIVRAITAVETIDRSDFRLVVVGDGDAMQTVRQRAGQANARLGRDAIVLTGALDDPRPAYDAADFVLGMGGSALRGLAFSRPVVIVGEDGFSEVFSPETVTYFLRHGYHGVGPSDPGAARLTEQLRSLFDAVRRAELSEFGAAIVRDRYALDVLTERLEQIYASSFASPLNAFQRWSDVAYVTGYDLAHRRLPPGLRHSLRRRIARLRTGTISGRGERSDATTG